VPIDPSSIGSLALSLDEILQRLRLLTEQAAEEDEIRGELVEVERQLHTATRRLHKAIRRL